MNDISQKILIGVATTIGIVVVTKLAVKFYTGVFVPAAAFCRMLSTLGDDVAAIKSEVMTNGGGSLKDEVKATNRMMAKLEARQRGLIAALPRATFETDEEFNWIEGNHAMERLTGVGFTQLSWRGWKSLVHEDDRVSVMSEINHAVKDKRGVGVTFRMKTDQGEFDVHMEATPTFEKPKMDQVLCWTGWIAKVDDRRIDDRRLS